MVFDVKSGKFQTICGTINRILEAVSYTHLDVYKRQLHLSYLYLALHTFSGS